MKDQIMLKSLVALVLFFIGISHTSMAANYPPKDKWDFIGTKNIGHIIDKDVIYVRSDRVRYKTIELRTDRPNIDLHKCVIHFVNGGKQTVRLRRDNRGGESHIIDLEGRARAIDKITIWGSRDYGKVFRIFNKGTVEVWGKVAKRANEDDRFPNYYRSNSNNWSNFDFNRSDRNRDREWEQARRDREREQARRDREREQARRDRERDRRDRERDRRDRDRDRDRGDRDRDDRRGSSICPPRRGRN